MVAITEEKEEDEKIGSRSSMRANKETTTSSALAGVKNFPKTISGLGKKVKEAKGIAALKPSAQLDKEKADVAKKIIEVEKEAVKYLKDDVGVILTSASDDIEFKRIDRIIAEKEKVSLVSDSLKASDVLDSVASNGAAKAKGDAYTEVMNNTALHVSSV